MKQRIFTRHLFSALTFIALFSIPIASKGDEPITFSPHGIIFLKEMIRQDIDTYLQDKNAAMLTYDFPSPEVMSNVFEISDLYARA